MGNKVEWKCEKRWRRGLMGSFQEVPCVMERGVMVLRWRQRRYLWEFADEGCLEESWEEHLVDLSEEDSLSNKRQFLQVPLGQCQDLSPRDDMIPLQHLTLSSSVPRSRI